MAHIINLETHVDERGKLIVVEKVLPFEIKRVYFIYDVKNAKRGFHRHKKTIQGAIAINGSCRFVIQSCKNNSKEYFYLNSPSMCLILWPEDFHWIEDFSHDCILLVLASEYYDINDYVFEPT